MANKPWDPKQQAFRDALRELRYNRGLKQQELGDMLGRKQSYISKYENGERKLGYLEVLDILEACENTVQEFQALYQTKVAEIRADYTFKKRKPKK